jgi:citrate synthase
MSPSGTWKTAVTQIERNRVAVRGYDIADLMGRVGFGAAVYLILRGALPSAAVGELMDAILVSSIDHGVTPPSVQASRNVASTGGPLNASVAAGILSINEFHGGAIERCAIQLGHIIHRCDESGGSMATVAEAVLDEMKSEGARMSGFGHRVHTSDPRTARLFELAEKAGVAGLHVRAARAVESVFKEAGKTLPINVDGAIGAILADLGFEAASMNGLFMIARVPGLIAHAIEEKERERPMRRIDPTAHEYDGPGPRAVE